MSWRSIGLTAASALLALAAWPTFLAHRSVAPAAVFTPAPVIADWKYRDRTVDFYERALEARPDNQVFSRTLALQYLQRFREQGDVGDIARAEVMARRSLAIQPLGNAQADMALGSALLTYHEFRQALRYERDAVAAEPFNDNALAEEASIEMELGEYRAARRILSAEPPGSGENPAWEAVQARYDELTGRLTEARRLIDRATRAMDSDFSNPAYSRSWFHMRAGQLAWEAGDDSAAAKEFDTALRMYPENSMALMFQARLYHSLGQWHQTLAAAERSAALYPSPQALGYEADAQRALGDDVGAAATDDLIRAVERLGNIHGINDRLLANYYAEHGVHLRDALRTALADHRVRGDEIYADDTVAWALAANGRWSEAYRFAELATRYGTQDPLLQLHAGIIAAHIGHRDEAKRRLETALGLNPRFHPYYAREARRLIAMLNDPSTNTASLEAAATTTTSAELEWNSRNGAVDGD